MKKIINIMRHNHINYDIAKVKLMLKQGVSITLIKQLTGLDIEVIQQIHNLEIH